jgi:2-polyprenyl-6-methoxyphenol hydroxylase-like FAD-dependent oxidoreductase
MDGNGGAPRALIVGAGIAGLAAAGAIRGIGWDVDIIERRASFGVAGTGLFLPANGVRALAALGILDSLADRGAAITRLRVRSADGVVENAADLDQVWPGVGPSVAVHRSVAHEALLEAAPSPIQMGAGLADLVAAGSEVEVLLADDSAARYDLLVGADGVDSTVRRLIWPDCPARYTGESYWRGIVASRAGVEDWTLSLCRAGNFLVIPVGSGMAYWAAMTTTDFAFRDEPAGRAQRVRDRFGDLAGPPRDVLDQITDDASVQFSAADQAWVENPVAGRIVLVGDAWHGTSPSMAQGGAMAAEDALVLVAELGRREFAGPDPVGDALGRYVARRLPRLRHVRETTAMRTSLASLPLEQRLGVVPAWEDISVRSFAPLVPGP